MRLRNTIDKLCFILFLSFSIWLFNKSFGYIQETHSFRIARNQVGDFGLHLALIRSISWGDNWTPQSPFFPGVPLRYHFATDILVGFLERFGVRIDYAYNGVSSILFAILLYFIYKIPQLIFRQKVELGIVSVLLFLFPSTLTWLEFVSSHGLFNLRVSDIWNLPDYINKGPFDGSIISIYFSLNPFLNQRHLVAGMAMGLGAIYSILHLLVASRPLSFLRATILGIFVAVGLYVHSLISFATFVVGFLLLIFYGKRRPAIYFCVAYIILALPFIKTMLAGLSHETIRLGFLVPDPVTIYTILKFWWVNLGVSIPLVMYGYIKSNRKQQYIFLSFLVVFIAANIFQFSYRIEHNHSLINYFFVAISWFVSYAIIRLWKSALATKVIGAICFVVLLLSGTLNLIAVKNDYQYVVADAPTNPFIEWIRRSTDKRAVFLSWEEQYDPITIAGRRTYVGHSYYTTVMGYDIQERKLLAQRIYEATTKDTFTQATEKGIQYIVIPNIPIPNFPYSPNMDLYDAFLPVAYKDASVIVYQL